MKPADTPTAWPLARIGYWYACTVGFIWGAVWSTGKIRRIDGLWVFTGMPKWTFGRGGSCVGNCYFTDQNTGTAVLRHERIHREQWKRYGMAMPVLYWIAGRDPLTNRFEIEAGLIDGGYVKRGQQARFMSQILSLDDEFRFLPGDAARVGREAPIPEVTRISTEVSDGRAVSALSWEPSRAPEFAFVHGVGLNAHGYDPTVLALDAPALSIDLPGHGRSDWREDANYRPDILALDVQQVLATHSSRPLTLVGHSLGGLTSMLVAAQNPTAITHLVIIDITPGLIPQQGASVVTEFILGKRDFASLDEMVDRAVEFGIGHDRTALSRGVALNSRKRADGRYEWTHHMAHLDQMPIASSDPKPYAPLWAALDSVATAGVPITLIAASNGLVNAELQTEWATHLPQSKIITLDGPHNLHEAAPLKLARVLASLS